MIGLRKSILSGHCPLFFACIPALRTQLCSANAAPPPPDQCRPTGITTRTAPNKKARYLAVTGFSVSLQQLKLLSAVLDDVFSSSCYRTIDQFHISHGSVIASTETTFHNANVATRTGLVTRAQFSEQLAYCFFATGTSKGQDRKSTRLNSSHVKISYAVCC